MLSVQQIEAAHARNLAVKRSRMASMPELGIFWLIDNKFVATPSLGVRLISTVASITVRTIMRPSGPRCIGFCPNVTRAAGSSLIPLKSSFSFIHLGKSSIARA
jgi:hypothetical protein